MTYGPLDRLPDLHLDPPLLRECLHPGLDDVSDCARCGRVSDFWCDRCENWIYRLGACECEESTNEEE